MPLTNLRDVLLEQDPTESVPSHKIMNYFKFILKILAGFILFCWTSTSNYFNSLNIDTDATYPIFGKTMNDVKNNPYATMFNPGGIDMQNEKSIKEKLGMAWWYERTQQSSYQVGGLILHKAFDFFHDWVQGSQNEEKKNEKEKGKLKSALLKFFSFLQWLAFAIMSNLWFAICFMIVIFLLWIPGFFGGLTAFMPLTYYTASPILQLYYKGLLLLFTFGWMCIAGWVTFFPAIYGFFHLSYLMLFKQLEDNLAGFVDEFMKRIGQLMYIYITVAFIIAVASKDLPNETKITVAVVFGASLIFYAIYNWYQARTSVESISKIV